MINTLTLNPAMDLILFIDRFERTVTARVREKTEALGGKGVHVSVNLALLGEKSRAFGALFGETGKRIENELVRMGVETLFTYPEGRPGADSRTNYVIIEETGLSTIIAEHGVDLTEDDIDALTGLMIENTEDGDFLILSGDASNVKDPYIYNHFIEALSVKNVKVFADASGPVLKSVLGASPFLIKPNRDELESVTGIEIKTREDALRAIGALDRYDIPNVALTLGAEGSIVRFGSGRILRALPPEAPVRNTVGCGDAFLSGLALGIARGLDEESTLREAAAVAAATAADPLTVGFDREFADSLAEKVKLETLR